MKKRNETFQRINLNSESKLKVMGWKKQVEATVHGVSTTYSNLMNLIIELSDEKLPRSILSELKNRIFDPIKATEWVAEEARKRKKEGGEVRIEEILAMLTPDPICRKKKSPCKIEPMKGTNNSVKKENHLTSPSTNC